MNIIQNHFFFFIFILLLPKLKFQLIISSNNIESEQKRISKIYSKIFTDITRTLLYQKTFKLPTDFLNLTLINFGVVDNEYVPYFIKELNVLAYFPNKIKMVLIGEYKEDIGGNFTIFNPVITINPYNCRIVSQIDENNHSFSASFSMVVENDDYFIKDGTPNCREIFIKDFIRLNEDIIKNIISISIDNGMKNYYEKKKPITFYTHYKKNISIYFNNLVSLCDSRKNNSDTIQCYYMGNLGNNDLVYNKKDAIDYYSDFFVDNKKYKMFFNMILINNILNEVILDAYYEDNNETLKNLSNYLGIGTNNDNKLFYKINDKKISFDNKNNLNINISYDTEFYSNDIIKANIFFSINLEINLDIELTGFNLCLNKFDSMIKRNHITLFENEIDEKDEELNEILSEIFVEKYFQDNNCFFEDYGIDLIDYFKYIDNYIILENGIIFEGESMN